MKEIKKPDQEIVEYTEAIQVNPADPEVFFSRAKAYSKKGDYSLAIADMDEALRLNPDFAEARLERGDVYAAMGDRKKAILEFQEVCRDEQFIERLQKDMEYRKSIGWDD
jgi:serine/threonine-protein kinase